MTSTTGRQTTIEADQDLPIIRITREFDAPPATVFRAWAEPDLVKQWLGPRSIDMDIDTWDCRTGGSYRYTALQDGAPVAHFYGSFHETVPGERIVQTFGFEEQPGAVALEVMTLEALDGGRCRVVGTSLVDSMEAQAAMLASGMEVGVNEGYEKLDEMLASGSV